MSHGAFGPAAHSGQPDNFSRTTLGDPVAEAASRPCHAASGLRSRWRFGSHGNEENQLSRLPLSAKDQIQQAIWLCLRFTLSFRDVEDLLAERGIMVSYETVRRWLNHFGPMVAADLRKRRPKPHSTWHLDEVYLKIDGRMVYLWRAVDAEGEVLDVLVRLGGTNGRRLNPP
jgi:DDE domain